MGFLSSLTGKGAAKQAQAEAIRAYEDAEAHNVTVQLGATNLVALAADEEQVAERTAQQARKRRYSLGSTLRSGLVGGGARRSLG